jgi:large subunit ribosomal protein L10Ae
MKVCIIADLVQLDIAKKDGLLTQTMDDLKKLNKNKKLVKKLCNQYDAFLASESIIKTIPRVVGPHMNRAGKFPTSVAPADNLKDKVLEQQSTVKFQLKKVLCLGTCVGHVGMNEDELRQNTVIAINFLVSLLKKNWQNLKSAYIKSTMGESQRIY